MSNGTHIDASALAQARERLDADWHDSHHTVVTVVDRTDLRLVLDALKEAEERLAKWPSLTCPCCGDEAAFATFFEDGQPTTCGCGGTVMADGDASIYINTADGICENPECAAKEQS